MVDGKKKGGKYERDISKLLSSWWTDGEDESVFWRTSGSGAKATVNHKKKAINFNYYGDIGYRDSIGAPFIERACIECKHYKEFYIMDILKDNKNPSEFEKFWEEAKFEAGQSNRWSILITKKNYFPDLIMIEEDIFLFDDKFESEEKLIYDNGVVVVLDKFLDRVKPVEFIERVPIKKDDN
jgi:hypothetical protein